MKIWFDKDDVDYTKFISEQFLLIPFFDQNIVYKNKDFQNSHQWVKSLSSIIKYSSIEDAHFLVYPNKLDKNIFNFIEKTKKYNKPILTFYNDDNDAPVNLPKYVKVFRTSINRANQKSNEYPLPAWSSDFKDNSCFRNKSTKPVIGFCGALTHACRGASIQSLQKNNNVTTNFIIRKLFWGGDPHNKQLRNEYIDNLKKSDLILCCRGAGNFSYRLYEALSMNKIPILIDTNNVLPCSDVIDWSKFILASPENINEKVDSFWKNLDNNKYMELQKYCRNIYETYLNPPGFAAYINHHYDNKLF